MLAVVPANLAGVFAESTVVPDTTAVAKKSKSASSAEEEDKEVFVLHVSKVFLTFRTYSFSCLFVLQSRIVFRLLWNVFCRCEDVNVMNG